MAIYTGIGGSAKSVSKIYTGVGGTARPVHKGYIGVDGVAKKFYDGGNPISSFALGTEFGIADPSGNTYWYKLVHKGVPGGGLYDSTANGAWLWRTGIAASTSISGSYIYGYEGWALDNWCVNYPGGNIKSSVANRLMTVHLLCETGGLQLGQGFFRLKWPFEKVLSAFRGRDGCLYMAGRGWPDGAGGCKAGLLRLYDCCHRQAKSRQ